MPQDGSSQGGHTRHSEKCSTYERKHLGNKKNLWVGGEGWQEGTKRRGWGGRR